MLPNNSSSEVEDLMDVETSSDGSGNSDDDDDDDSVTSDPQPIILGKDSVKYAPNVPVIMPRRRFSGHCNTETVKDGKKLPSMHWEWLIIHKMY